MFGKIHPCPMCNPLEKSQSVGLNAKESKIKLDDIVTQGRPGTQRMVAAARKFIEDNRIGFLTVHGTYGNAKTTLLQAVVNDCVKRNIPARYITMTEVMAYAREAFESNRTGDTDFGRIQELAKIRVIAIDEIEKARLSDYSFEVQTHLFNYRYRLSHELGTILAWNGAFNDIDMPSVLSRLSQFPVVENNDSDMRPLLRSDK